LKNDLLQAATAAIARREFARAEPALQEILRSEPQQVEALLGMGVVALEQKRYRQAGQWLDSALALAPGHAQVLANCAALRRTLGQIDEATRLMTLACQAAPGDVMIALNHALLLQDGQRLREAAEIFALLASALPEFALAHYHLGHVLVSLGDHGRAQGHFVRCLQIQPRHEAAFHGLIACLFAAGAHARALQLLQARLGARPFDSYSLALKWMALRSLDRAQEAAPFDDSRDWVRSFELEAPTPFADRPAFDTALFEQVRGHPDLMQVSGQATVNGQRVEELLQAPLDPLGAVGGLQPLIEEKLQSCLQWMHGRRHAFGAALPGRLQLRGWAVLMHTGGHETPHLHPGGVLSAVYYPRLPDVMKATAKTDLAGAIAFGQPDAFFPIAYTPEVGHWQPREGLLLVFPSYLWHHTLPFASAQPRLSLAFDGMPA
jgi:Tfp pilus assembly protein PilF